MTKLLFFLFLFFFFIVWPETPDYGKVLEKASPASADIGGKCERLGSRVLRKSHLFGSTPHALDENAIFIAVFREKFATALPENISNANY